ncbi:MAG: hypothetical protein ACE5IQ_06660 [Candidatus Methylomirabilales bacterium]
MSGHTMETLVDRLESLERQSRRMKRVGVGSMALIAAVVLMGQAMPKPMAKVVEAEKFVLRDARGTARAWLDMSADSVNLALADRDEQSRAFVYVQADGTAGLAFFDKDRARRVGLFVSADGSPGLSLAGKDGNTRVQAHVAANGRPDLSLTDTHGRRIGLLVLPDGTPAFGLADRTMKIRAALGLEPDGGVRLVFSDRDARERAELAVLPDGTPRLSLIGHTGRLVWHGP